MFKKLLYCLIHTIMFRYTIFDCRVSTNLKTWKSQGISGNILEIKEFLRKLEKLRGNFYFAKVSEKT